MNLYFSGDHYHLPAAVICPAESRALPGFPSNVHTPLLHANAWAHMPALTSLLRCL